MLIMEFLNTTYFTDVTHGYQPVFSPKNQKFKTTEDSICNVMPP